MTKSTTSIKWTIANQAKLEEAKLIIAANNETISQIKDRIIKEKAAKKNATGWQNYSKL